ncbi:MAG: ATP-grasp domain-containing protein [Blautia sp.]|nr:ATP-grasp domain-containing protein [Blautia sp.]
MINVLVLGVGGNVSQGILKALRKTGLDLHIVGACISPLSTGLYMCDEACISPYANEEGFIDWLVQLCNDKKIDIVLTGVEENIRRIAKDIDAFRAGTEAIFVSSTYEQLLIGQDKLRTCKWLKENGCNYPAFCELPDKAGAYKLAEEKGYPLIAKPVSGKSAQGIYVIHDEAELAAAVWLEGYVLEECLGTSKDEYTVGCYCNKEGQLMDVIVMHRDLKHGTTIHARVVENEAIRAEAEKICKAYKPGGPMNIQMRIDKDGRPVCFEMNVRFSGTTAMRANFGFCDVEAMIREYVLGEKVDGCFHVRPGEAFRFDEEMYIFGDAVQDMTEKHCIPDMSVYEMH